MINKIINRLDKRMSLYEKDLIKYCKYEKNDYPFINFNIKSEDKRIEDSINRYNVIEQKEYIYQFEGNLAIEPIYGFVILNGHVLKPSLPYYYDTAIPMRSILKLMTKDVFKKDINVIHEKAVISLRDVYENNYFHFFNDVITKLVLLEKQGFIEDIPIVVSQDLYNKSFFQGFLNRNGLRDSNLIIQDQNTFIKADRVLSCKAMPHDKLYYDEILNRLKVPLQSDSNKKIFLIRKTDCNNGRFLINLDEISTLMLKYDFEIIDPGTLSLDKQIDTFSSCRVLVGIHGAGMTNIMYRRDNKMSIIEIFPPDNIPPHYYWLSKIFGYTYDSISGEKIENEEDKYIKNSFIINSSILENKIKDLQ